VPIKQAKTIRDALVLNRSVHHLSYRKCLTVDDGQSTQKEAITFEFMCVNKKTHELIDMLTRYGVSAAFGCLSVSALSTSKPRVQTLREDRNQADDTMSMSSRAKKRRKYRVDESLSYDEVYNTIDSQLHLTFDYLALIVVGGIIAAIGLLTNSAVSVVASMLVSPLMGPIVGMTFGAVIKDWDMFWKSFRNELVGVMVCFTTGAFMGFLTAPLMNVPLSDQLAYGVNTQISSRGEWLALAWGAGIAAPSGMGVALGVSSDQVSALIGVAISAALLPPIVNSGICLSSAFVYWADTAYSNYIVQLWWSVGYISFFLFLMNWLLIFIFGYITFRVKNLHLSAHDSRRMQELGKFYAYEYDESSKSVRKKSKEDLNTPLLRPATVATSPNYSESGPKTQTEMMTFDMESSDPAAMGGMDDMAELKHWDTQPRQKRGMSEIGKNDSSSMLMARKNSKRTAFDDIAINVSTDEII